MKAVIVGGVAGGASTGARLRRLDDSAEIVILEKGYYVSFANCGLPYHIGGEIPERESLLLQTPESLSCSLALDVRTGHEVVAIDRDAKQVEVRDIADMDRIIARLDNGATSAVVVGGSYIGLELTEAFRTRGLRTTVIERAGQLMPWLDPEMTRILDYHVDTHDVDLRLATSATAVRPGQAARFALDLSDGTSVEGDVVVMAGGARAQVDLARAAGLEIGPRGGIVVDDRMRTSAPGILAAGDESAYRGTQGTAVVKAFDMTAGGPA